MAVAVAAAVVRVRLVVVAVVQYQQVPRIRMGMGMLAAVHHRHLVLPEDLHKDLMVVAVAVPIMPMVAMHIMAAVAEQKGLA